MRPASALAKRFAMCLCAALCSGGGARAAEDPAIYPAAQCAAFWLGFSDYAQRSAFLDYDPDDLTHSQMFRDIAVNLSPSRTDEIDAKISSERTAMALLVEAMIYGGDEQSRDVVERLTATCDRFAADHPNLTDPD